MKQILLSRLLNLSSQSIGVGFVMVARIKERDGKPLDEYISDPVAFHNKRFKFGKLDHRHDGIYFFGSSCMTVGGFPLHKFAWPLFYGLLSRSSGPRNFD